MRRNRKLIRTPQKKRTFLGSMHQIGTKARLRFTRLTIGFSKKWDNLRAALALNFAYYNFCWIRSTIKCTLAMEAGITKHV